MDARRIQQIYLSFAVAIIFFIGITVGYTIGYYRATNKHFPEIQFIGEINLKLPTIKLMEVKNGKLSGEISGAKIRVAYSPNNVTDYDDGQKFEIPINSINLKNYYQTDNIPENALFIASINGKYYYSVLDKRALNISEKNRIYFSDAKKAEKMGYTKK